MSQDIIKLPTDQGKTRTNSRFQHIFDKEQSEISTRKFTAGSNIFSAGEYDPSDGSKAQALNYLIPNYRKESEL